MNRQRKPRRWWRWLFAIAATAFFGGFAVPVDSRPGLLILMIAIAFPGGAAGAYCQRTRLTLLVAPVLLSMLTLSRLLQGDSTLLSLTFLGTALVSVTMIAGAGHGSLEGVFGRPPVKPRYAPGLCQSCGYDLTGNVSGKCSECGTAIGKATRSA